MRVCFHFRAVCVTVHVTVRAELCVTVCEGVTVCACVCYYVDVCVCVNA